MMALCAQAVAGPDSWAIVWDMVSKTGPVGLALVLLTWCLWMLMRSANRFLLPLLQAAQPIVKQMSDTTVALERMLELSLKMSESQSKVLERLTRLEEDQRRRAGE